MNIITESSYYRLVVKEGREAGLKVGLFEGFKEGLKEGRVMGKIEEARRLILRQCQIRFGPPEAEVRARIESISDVDRLEQLSDRVLVVESWAELVVEGGNNRPSPLEQPSVPE